MPYIAQHKRPPLDRHINALVELMKEPGDLNYVYSMLAKGAVEKQTRSYALLNSILGVFEAAKTEFYRRVVVPYEDGKMEENGDVYSVEKVVHGDTVGG